jgi:hypothetical protein
MHLTQFQWPGADPAHAIAIAPGATANFHAYFNILLTGIPVQQTTILSMSSLLTSSRKN